MDTSFATCLAFTKAEEGGMSTDARDGGCFASGVAGSGPLIGSNCGISAAVLAAYMKPARCTRSDMTNLSAQALEAIYRTGYWMPLACDRLPAGLDLMLQDHAFNAGVHASAKLLQDMLQVPADGWIGDQTVAAIGTLDQLRLIDLVDADAAHGLQQALGLTTSGVIDLRTWSALDHRAPSSSALLIITALAARHSRFYRALAGFPTYGAGWLARARRRQLAALHLAANA